METLERESKRRVDHIFDYIISVENLLSAWQEFLRGKRERQDVKNFSIALSDNILNLHRELISKTYQHGSYESFKINDPKPRDIHKANVRDRLLHHAIYRVLYPYFDPKFIFDSYSCRLGKGTHRALNRFREFERKASHNNTGTAWILKGDIRKFFANINHGILLGILRRKIPDENIIWLLEKIINSFHAGNNPDIGLPLGNLTSQLLVNIYMNEFDHFIKQDLKITCYIRYADDFVIFHESKKYLENILPIISSFLKNYLKLSLHPDKVFVKTIASGMDFLGWANFPHHRVLRTASKKRMLKNLKEKSLTSYSGLLSYGDTYKLQQKIIERLTDPEQKLFFQQKCPKIKESKAKRQKN
ncbi:MAG TPA: reverse transcriptase/maturase family protein [bacterium]|nr:reverse transcriptase/maturase family protein [bacterium]